MTHSDPLDLLRRALAASDRRPDGPPTAACLDEETTAALVDGRLDPAARAAAVAHLATCQRCATAVASVSRALADPRMSRAIAGAEGRGFRHLSLVAIPVVAAALVLVFVLPRRAAQRDHMHRAPTITATPAPLPVSPTGTVAEPGPLRWASVAATDRYRVTLFDAGGRVLYERELPDTMTALPDSVHLVDGRPYFWRVEARTGWNRWAASRLIEFRIAGAPR